MTGKNIINMARRKWELNVEDSERWQYVIGEEPRRYFLRQSNFALNYQAYFIENWEDTFKRKAKILEFGSGCTTIWWAKNFPDNEIITVESGEWWREVVQNELNKIGAKNVRMIYHPADEGHYTSVLDEDLSYSKSIDETEGDFTLIINDGAQREMVGDHILRGIDQGKKYLSEGGLYLRHDYEMAVLGNWVGLRDGTPPVWCRDKMDLGYEMFCATHPEYVCTTVTGNHIASMVIELGGIWRKQDFKWKQKMDNLKEVEDVK